jgi:hypothetical protein
MPLVEFESFISDTIELEHELGTDTYIGLLTFDYKSKVAIEKLGDLIFDTMVSEGEFETWTLTELLKDFISHPEKSPELLDDFHRLYNISAARNGDRVNGYRFLGHLALNGVYWLNEGYLRLSYGDNWQTEYDKLIKQIPFYHQQLKPIAEKILHAIAAGEIKILSRGRYTISGQLKDQLEQDKIFQLIHPDPNEPHK